MPDTSRWHRSVTEVIGEVEVVEEARKPFRFLIRPSRRFTVRLECGHQKQVTAYRCKTQKAFPCEFCRYGE